ncbi:hypothetical protein MCERE19_02528 [Spirosomataceae bacterium]|jgi:hypothetical protein
MKLNFFTLALFFSATFSSFSQSFMEGFDRFSSKKITYLTLSDGSKVEGVIEDLDRKRGNISEISLKVDGKKKTYKPDQIKEMYLPASGLDKLSKQIEVATNFSKDLNSDRITDGYGFFEYTQVEIKGKVQSLLMQLVNPGFHNKVRVYFNPFATETMSVDLGPMKVGGLDRSYFVKVGDEPAYRITKGNYNEKSKELFKGCAAAMSALKKDSDWSKFERIVYVHFGCK